MTSNIEMWLTYNGEKEKIHIPVLPEEFSISYGSKDKSVDVIGLGEILIPGDHPAVEVSFSSFFPAKKFPGLQAGKIEKNPQALRNTIIKWKDSKKPVHLIIAGCGVDCYCRISKFKATERGGDVGTIYYDITLKEYREPKVRTVKLNTSSKKATTSNTTKRTDNTTKSRTYTVKTGDCLWNIALKYYGDGSKYTKIYNANKDKIKSNYIIYTGQVLKIPD